MFHYFKNKKNQGFSLMELMMVIAIIGIMTVVGFASTSSIKKNSLLRASQNEIASAIKLVQSYALQGKTINDAGNWVVPCEYGFEFTDKSSYRTFYALTCGDAGTTLANYNLVGVVLENPSSVGDTSMTFSIPSATLSPGPVSITIAIDGSPSDQKSIIVKSKGLVSDLD
jgi:prepilin-type N-terminal cleavage/methylation domain-containing protein